MKNKTKLLSLLLIMSFANPLMFGCSPKTPSARAVTTQPIATPIPTTAIIAPADAPFDVNSDVPTGKTFTLPNLISAGMVLQRDMQIKIWGQCQTDGAVAAIINGTAYFGECKSGKFEIMAGPIAAGGPYDITIRNATEKKVIPSVLFGDVYLCGGQSNMRITIGEIDSSLAAKYENTNVKYLCVAQAYSETELDTCSGNWVSGSKANILGLSTVAVIYGSTLQKKYNIPIGIITSSVGGTFAAAWLPKEEAELCKPIPYVSHTTYPGYTSEPSYFFNAMIYPLKEVKFKGVLWYQGEGQAEKYDVLLKNVIGGWRRTFNNEDLPFIIIQLPIFKYEFPGAWATVREAQALVGRTTKNVTYTVNIDHGDANNLHPLDKEPVGIRAAQAAMSLIYGESGILKGPTYKSFSVSGDSIIIELENIGTGLKLIFDGKSFEICGADNKYYDAIATIDGNKIILKSANVPAPKNAQYCYSDCPTASLFNNEGFPCEPFRTQTY